MPKRLSDAPEPKQSVNWVFTINNWTEDDKAALRTAGADAAVKRIVWQEEICPTTGTPHLQGYVILAAKKTKLGVCRFLLPAPDRWKQCRARPCYSDVVNSEKYCSNPDKLGAQNYEEHGQALEDAAGALDTKDERAKAVIDLAEKGDWVALKSEYPTQYLYCQSQLTKVFARALKAPECHDGVLDNYWIYGAPGSGKDDYLKSLLEARNEPVYKKAANTKWWNDYSGQRVVWYQDFGKGAAHLIDEYKLWLDRDHQQVESKYGVLLVNPASSYISSQYHPSRLFPDDEDYNAIIRRVQIIHVVNGVASWAPRENVQRPPLAVRRDVEVDEEHAKRRRLAEPPSPNRFTSSPERF